jgi:hypothetical protein
VEDNLQIEAIKNDRISVVFYCEAAKLVLAGAGTAAGASAFCVFV